MDNLVENSTLYLKIMEYRNTFFRDEQSYKVLTDIIFVILGLFENVESGDMAHTIKQNCARKILRNLGILHPVNNFDIIQALAALPVKKEVYSAITGPEPFIGGNKT